jgi:hypothetical protein
MKQFLHPVSPSRVDTLVSHQEEQDLARRRRQAKGYLRAESGSWLLTYRVYTWDLKTGRSKPERVTVPIGPAPNPPTRRRRSGELTLKQAERFAWDHYLSKLDNATVRPFSTLTLAQFWEKRYVQHLERKKKYATQTQYKSLWKRWIQPAIGQVRLFDLKPDQVDATCNAALAANKSTATAKHIKKVVSAMIEHARWAQMFTGENPAQLVEATPHVAVRKPRAMTVEQCRRWLAAVTDEIADPKKRQSVNKPLRTISLLGLCCSMGVSEQLGLLWRHLNLTSHSCLVDGERPRIDRGYLGTLLSRPPRESENRESAKKCPTAESAGGCATGTAERIRPSGRSCVRRREG